METFTIECYETLINFNIDEGDRYTKKVYVKVDRELDGEIRFGTDMFLTPDQLKSIGLFFLLKAEEFGCSK